MNKMRCMLALSLAMVATALVITPGCEKPVGQVISDNSALIKRTLQTAGEQGAKLGLKKWAEKHPDAAKEAAVALSRNIDEKILPYLNGDVLGASDQVSELIDSSLFNGVPDEVKMGIQAAAVVLDLYLPIPSATENLNADHVAFLKAFMAGLKDGCDSFLGARTAKSERYWISK